MGDAKGGGFAVNMQLYFAAMWISSVWFEEYEHFKTGIGMAKEGKDMRMANYCRARGIVLHDRILNGELRRTKRTIP